MFSKKSEKVQQKDKLTREYLEESQFSITLSNSFIENGIIELNNWQRIQTYDCSTKMLKEFLKYNCSDLTIYLREKILNQNKTKSLYKCINLSLNSILKLKSVENFLFNCNESSKSLKKHNISLNFIFKLQFNSTLKRIILHFTKGIKKYQKSYLWKGIFNNLNISKLDLLEVTLLDTNSKSNSKSYSLAYSKPIIKVKDFLLGSINEYEIYHLSKHLTNFNKLSMTNLTCSFSIAKALITSTELHKDLNISSWYSTYRMVKTSYFENQLNFDLILDFLKKNNK